MKTILLYGDSNTWGFNPILPAGQIMRYVRQERWGGVLQAQLGDDYNVLEEAWGAAPRHWRIPPPRAKRVGAPGAHRAKPSADRGPCVFAGHQRYEKYISRFCGGYPPRHGAAASKCTKSILVGYAQAAQNAAHFADDISTTPACTTS